MTEHAPMWSAEGRPRTPEGEDRRGYLSTRSQPQLNEELLQQRPPSGAPPLSASTGAHPALCLRP